MNTQQRDRALVLSSSVRLDRAPAGLVSIHPSLGRKSGRRPVPQRALSALELLVGIVIIGLVAALTIPQLSRASSETREQALRRTLASLRTAIDMYYRDHGVYPAATGAGDSEPASGAAFIVHMTRPASDADSAYLRDGVPISPVRTTSGGGVLVVRGATLPGFVADSTADWVYNCDNGYIVANSDALGGDGIRFDRY